MKCAWCGRSLADGEDRPIPRLLVNVASLALALGHGGLWAKNELAESYCGRCRGKVIALALSLAVFGLSVGGIGAALWLRGP